MGVFEFTLPMIEQAIDTNDGLIAIGGELSVPQLVAAYEHGVFPWFSEGEPICWWALAPRTILLPPKLHVGRSLQKTLRNTAYKVTLNQAFDQVIQHCADVVRPEQGGTWITDQMRSAYSALHRAGHAHSFEYWRQDPDGQWRLQGGLYGVQIGRVFFGESMFALAANASKIAFVHAVRHLHACGVGLIDCQMDTPHLARFGSELLPFLPFYHHLQTECAQPLASPLVSADLVISQP
ncbi:leucyl/phenylalanyl-tRNA--protein transferase [Neisseriaceae bacterium CLB008]